jgi:hypothetical protein
MRLLCFMLIVAISTAGAGNAADQSPATELASELSSKLPAQRRPLKSQRQLRPVDSLIPCAQLDCIIALRGTTLSSISMLPPHAETVIADNHQFANRELIDVVWLNEPVLVLNEQSGEKSAGRSAIVFFARSKKIFSLSPQKFTLVKGSRFDTTIVALSPDRKTAVFRLSYAGPSQGMPDKRNSPKYCWVNLLTGKVAFAAEGWDPLFVLGDLSGVIFQGKYVENSFKSPPRHLLKLADGTWSNEIPDLEKVPVFEFDWGNTSDTRGLVRRKGQGDTYLVQGMASAGRVFWPLQFPAGLEYPKTAQIVGGFGALHIRKSNERDYDECLWMIPLLKTGEARRLTEKVGAFAVLPKGKCVFSGGELQGTFDNQVRESTCYYDYPSEQSLNLWADFPALKPVKSKTVKDSQSSSIVSCFGSDKYPAAAFLRLRHDVADYNAAPNFPPSSAGPRVSQTRICDYFITDGHRALLGLPDSTKDSFFIAHKSASIIAQKEKWTDDGRRTYEVTVYDF